MRDAFKCRLLVEELVVMLLAPLSMKQSSSRAMLVLLFLAPLMLTGGLAAAAMESIALQEPEPPVLTPAEIWSQDYINEIYPWADDDEDQLQFKEYHDFESMRARMMYLASRNPSIAEFHEGLNGGVNKRGITMTKDSYEGWFYNNPSPWMKITGNVAGGDYNAYNGDNGNYEDRPDIMLVGNHHAREWMSYEVPMFFLEMVMHYYGQVAVDNDGDGLIDEDTWGDSNGDGQLDDDGDCLSLNASFQDSNGDGENCGPGDLGVDEDFSEVWITDLVNSREIYLIPMLNTDGNIYDHEVWVGDNCAGEAWGDDCRRSGWRKNLRDNTYTGVTPIPDIDEDVDSSCDGVDLNRNYQYEWGAPLGATGPLIPGDCIAGTTNNDVYNGPVDDTDNDGDCVGPPTPQCVNEDHVDGNDDDADGQIDEDWWGGNSEPETLFIQDMTEMNDDDGDGSSEFAATLTWHSFSELVLYPWGHCTNCQSPDHDQLIYHGNVMAEMTGYDNMQSSDLYPTTGDFCDWHYGVHDSYCYTMEIGNNFHEHPDDIDHISVRNVGVAFYMIEIADNPRERADLEIAGMPQKQHIMLPDNVSVPDNGPIPIDICVDRFFPWSNNSNVSHVMYRTLSPNRQQTEYGPREWSTEPWSQVGLMDTEEGCLLLDGSNGTRIRAEVPVPDDMTGELHYKSMLGTLSGAFPYTYPADSKYHVLEFPYRAPFGDFASGIMLFAIVAAAVWGGLGLSLRLIMKGQEEVEGIPDIVIDGD